jgi:hypothetical protein
MALTSLAHWLAGARQWTQVDVDKPLGLSLAQSDSPNGGVVVKVRPWRSSRVS